MLGHLTYKLSETDASNVLNQTVPEVEKYGSPGVRVELKAGQASVHSDLLLHGSDANTSDRRRCGLTLRFTHRRREGVHGLAGSRALWLRATCRRTGQTPAPGKSEWTAKKKKTPRIAQNRRHINWACRNVQFLGDEQSWWRRYLVRRRCRERHGSGIPALPIALRIQPSALHARLHDAFAHGSTPPNLRGLGFRV